jgi:hypothetical protein
MEARFVAKLDKTDSCWLWTGFKKNGYGQFWLNRKPVYSHRVAYEMWVGPIPDGLLIRHKCDNRLCCNPEHLEPGTIADNMRDKVERGRQYHPLYSHKGQTNPFAKLTEDDVREIRVLLGFGMKGAELATRFSVSEGCVSNIKSRRNWKHI